MGSSPACPSAEGGSENSWENSSSLKPELREHLVLVAAAVSFHLFMQCKHQELCMCGVVLECKIIPSGCSGPAGGAQQEYWGIGEGNKGAKLAVKDGSDAALCAFVLLISEGKKHFLKYCFSCVQPTLLFSFLGTDFDAVK